MSKKDKDKDKRKKGSASERPSAWIADLRPQREQRKTAAPPPPPAAAAPSADDLPPTRRSSPLPETEEGVDLHIPALRPVSFDVHSFDGPLRGHPPIGGPADTESAEPSWDINADVAPIGPTEPAGDSVPESQAAPTEAARAPGPASVKQLEQQIRELEARLDEMIARGAPTTATPPAAAPTREPQAAAEARIAPPPHRPIPRPAPSAPTARELLSTDFYLRQWGRAGMRKRAEEVDEFGLDPTYEARLLPFLDFLYKHYFRVEVEGTEHIPEEGRCLMVANHSGGPLPYDGVMLRAAVRREHPQQRELRWLAEDFVYHLPFVGTAMNRLGAVRACQENAERLLAGERLVAVFPEGVKGIGKLFKDRYRLQRFGRGGFIRLCLRTGTPIVPSAIVGAEEANPMLYRVEYLTKALGIPYLPITPTFPALGPLGLLPAPTKWKIAFGEPIRFDGYGPDAENDEILVGRLAERVRATIQALVDRTLAGRQSVWFG